MAGDASDYWGEFAAGERVHAVAISREEENLSIGGGDNSVHRVHAAEPRYAEPDV
jgi:hypothetical protein